MDVLQSWWRQASEFWRKLTPGNRVALGSASILALVAAIAVGFWSYQTDYRVLYAGIAADDANGVINKLTTLGISYKLANGGTTILVPADQVQQARVSVGADAATGRGPLKGRELFDEVPFGATPAQMQALNQRALEGELARSLMQIDAVASARVLIARPESTPFRREQQPTTASVVLRLKPGSTFNRTTASAAVSLVARGVEGLKPENVTLVDSRGLVLSERHGSEADAAVAAQLDYRTQLEHELAAKAEEMLVKTLGYGRVIVKVTADVNNKRLKQHKETYDPEARAVSQEKVVNSKSGSSGSRGGIVGVASNPGRGAGGGGGGSTSAEETVTTEYMVSKTVMDLEDKTGDVERLTIAAMVDLTPAEGGEAAMTLSDVQDTIKQAVGFKVGRDEIKVTNVKMANPIPPEPDEEALQMQRLQGYVVMGRNISVGLSALLGAALLVLLVRRLRPRSAKPAKSVTATPTPEEETSELTDLARRDPDLVARVLAGYMSEN